MGSKCKLILKLQAMGIRGPLLLWLKSYLSDRQVCVRIDGEMSEWFSVNAGVPHGDILAPLLFLCFINDCMCASTYSSLLYICIYFSSYKLVYSGFEFGIQTTIDQDFSFK